MDENSAKIRSSADTKQDLSSGSLAGSAAVLVLHYTAEESEADNKRMDALNSDFKHPTCAQLRHPSAEILVQKKVDKLMDFVHENFGVAVPTQDGKEKGVAGQVKSSLLEVFEVSKKRRAEGDENIVGVLGKVTNLGNNLVETIRDVCLEFSDFVGNLAELREVVGGIEAWLSGIEEEVRGKQDGKTA